MDTVEATKMVMSRIQKLDPENATKIMGYILIQDQGENEMIRLAFGPENLLVSVIKQAKSFLDISSNTSCASRNTPQIIIPNHNGGGFHGINLNPSSPSSPWSLSGSGSGSFPEHIPHRNSPRPSPASYAAVVNGNQNFFNNFNDQSEEFNDQLLEFNEPNWSMESENCSGGHNLHRRSCSVNDMFLAGNVAGADDGNGGFGGWRPCMYFARGFCKNGTSCKFVHGNGSNNGFCDEIGSGLTGSVGSPTGKLDPFEDLLRFKAIHQQQQQQQQQRIAAMAAGNGAHFPFNRCMNFINENPRSNAAAALMMGDDFHKFGRCRPDRNDFGPMGFGNSNSSSRQIYLTFPADSTFKEEDVSNYFSMFGPVQDVRIPYQQKRMFGFVTFMLPETVKAILAKGNPHFVCDSRVLVKPYKEKGKIPDKKHHQQMERGDFSGCLSPTALESAEPFDHIPFGARMFNHEMMIRRKIEERELQQAMEFQDRRLMNLQLNDLKHHQFQRSLSLGVAVPSPTQMMNQNAFSSNGNIEEFVSGAKVSPQNSMHSASDESEHNVPPDFNVDDENATGGQDNSDENETDKNESFEHSLPDNLFASPTKSAASDHQTIFTTDMPETDYPSVSVTPKCQAIEM